MNIELKPDQIIDDRYTITEPLGQGGMGAVWKATDARTNDSVVVLKFPLKYNDPEILERFAREAGTMRELAGDCANILDIQDIGSVPVNDIDNVPYYVMRFQTGGALRDWQPPQDDSGNPVFTRESLNWVTGVATALDFLHHQDNAVFHRDVKPENILFDASGTPKLSDFGIVKSIKKATTNITQTGAGIGTVAYMPPEIWRGDDFSSASDQFSFVSTVYEMIAGKRPYDGSTPFAMLESIGKGHQKLKQTIGFSAVASDALDKGLAHEPVDRFESCGAFARSFLQGVPTEQELKTKPSEMATGMVSGIGNGTTGGGQVVGGTPIAAEPPMAGGQGSTGKLFGAPPIKPILPEPILPAYPPDPVASSGFPKAALFGVAALLLVGLIGGGLFVSGGLSSSDTSDQPLTVRPSSSSSATATLRPASFEFAQDLFTGTGGESTDKSRAFSILKELARDGSLESQKRLGEIFSKGEFGDVDHKESFQWFLMAAKQGDAESEMAVGASYATGDRGVGEDLSEAARWLKRARSSGLSEAGQLLADVEKRLRPEELTNSIGMKFRLISAGEFMMGSRKSAKTIAELFDSKESNFSDEHPRHRVSITRDFYLGKHEVTVGQFRQFVSDTGYKTEAEKSDQGGRGFNQETEEFEDGKQYSWRDPGFPQTDRHPVANVTWNDAVAFCEWLSKKEGEKYRLPTEAEWEYSCRGGTSTLYHHGDDPEGLADVGNVHDGTATDRFGWKGGIKSKDGHVFLSEVGTFKNNAFGLYDMHGNVWEWCSDWYADDYYESSPRRDPQGPDNGSSRVLRGGSWVNSSQSCRSALRFRFSPDFRSPNLGFRVLRSSSSRR